MDETFREFVETLWPSFEHMMQMSPLKISSLPSKLPEKCIYLLSEAENHFYVGRTRKLRNRMRQRSRAGAQHNQAVFVFRLAREVTGRSAAAYEKRRRPCSRLQTVRDKRGSGEGTGTAPAAIKVQAEDLVSVSFPSRSLTPT